MATRAAVFCDADVPDLPTLLAGIDPGVAVFRLGRGAAPLEQISGRLAGAGLSGLSAIHLVVLGAPGALRFAAGTVSAATIASSLKQVPNETRSSVVSVHSR